MESEAASTTSDRPGPSHASMGRAETADHTRQEHNKLQRGRGQILGNMNTRNNTNHVDNHDDSS